MSNGDRILNHDQKVSPGTLTVIECVGEGNDEGIKKCQEPIFQEIVDDLEAALEQFRLIANDLGGESSEKTTA
jgi:hypothetical protein